jgi:hypothetical protein
MIQTAITIDARQLFLFTGCHRCRAGTLSELVHKYRHTLSSMAALDILDFTDNLCVREPCVNFEKCNLVLKFGSVHDTVATDDFIFKPINPVSTFACACPEGFASNIKKLGVRTGARFTKHCSI